MLETRVESLKLQFEKSKEELINCLTEIAKGHNVEYHTKKVQDILNNNIQSLKDTRDVLNIPRPEFEEIVNNSFNKGTKDFDLIKNQNQSNMDSNTQLLESSKDLGDTQLVESSKDLDKVLESNVFSPIVDYFNYIQEMLSGLTLEQHACFVNGLGFFLVFLTLNSLVSAYFGNKIINYFKLEKRYPRLAKIIEYRIKFLNYYFILNIVFMYFFTIFFILVNIFFFFN